MAMTIIEDQCPTCYRTFNPDVLERHIPICNKVNTKFRKPMDVQRQRLQGSDIAIAPPKRTNQCEDKPKKNNWKEKHEDFLKNIRYARRAKAAEDRGETIAPPPPSQKPSDHVDCPTCGRSFNPNSAERHIAFCAEQAKRKPVSHKAKAEAAARRDKMLNFKPGHKKKEQRNTPTNTQYSPTNYTSLPHSRTLRATENRSAPSPHRGGSIRPPARYNSQVERVTMVTDTRTDGKMYRQQNNQNHLPPARTTTSARGAGRHSGSKYPPFCHECGYKYPVKTARFCCECGAQRLTND